MDKMSPRSSAALTPALAWLLLEPQRAFWEAFALLPAWPLLETAPGGDGHPVIVFPGFLADDVSTAALRGFLSRMGHTTHTWGEGRNLGPRKNLMERLEKRVDAVYTRSGQKVSLVGWSLGGVYAREMAKWMPDKVRTVVSLGSPFGNIARGTHVTRLLDCLRPERPLHWDPGMVAALRQPPSVPSSAIYSRTDGIAHWRACCELETDHTENIEVPSSHCGLGFNPLVFWAVTDRLSQAEGEWQRFAPPRWAALAYG